MDSGTSLPAKKDVVLALLEGTDVFVHLDPRTEGVRVPAWFKRQPQLVLQVGLNMPVPIPDLEVDDEAVSCTLSFNRSPFFCFVPWAAIYALVGADGRAMVWPDDVPPEVAAQAASAGAREGDGRRLRAVSDPDDAPEATEAPERSAPEHSQARASVAPETSADGNAATDSDDVPAPEAAPRGKAGGKKLPPYLRVVK